MLCYCTTARCLLLDRLRIIYLTPQGNIHDTQFTAIKATVRRPLLCTLGIDKQWKCEE